MRRKEERKEKSLIFLIGNALLRFPSPFFLTTISKKSSLLHFTYLYSLTLLLSFYLRGRSLFFFKACISTIAFNLIPFCFPLTLAPSINSFTQQFQTLCSFHSSMGPLPLALKKKKKKKRFSQHGSIKTGIGI